MTSRPLILVVDDDLIVHNILDQLLKKEGYLVITSDRGSSAIGLAEEKRPDLILLDIMMPEMNGFEVIKRLKSQKTTRDIPVVFLSAKTDAPDKVKGLEMGASDFINKPFDRAELLARIKTQVKLKRQEEELRKYSHDLEKMVEERTRQLIHADRLASLGTLSAGIAHEINNPTTFISGNIQTLEYFWKKVDERLQDEGDKTLKYILAEVPAMIQAIRLGAMRITEIVSGLKAFARKEAPVKTRVNLNNCVEEALGLTHNKIKYNIEVIKELPNLPLIRANHQQVVQVIVNLILNAADAIGKESGQITINGQTGDQDYLKLFITDTGHGIPPEIQKKLFDPFFTTKPAGEGTGLGLSIAHGIIEDHDGSIEVSSKPKQGATFIIKLPLEPIE